MYIIYMYIIYMYIIYMYIINLYIPTTCISKEILQNLQIVPVQVQYEPLCSLPRGPTATGV